MRPNPYRVNPSLRAPKLERLARIVRDPSISLANGGGARCRQVVAEDCAVRMEASLDEDEIRNAYRVLAALGDETSQRALAADCWADAQAEALKLAA
jgi:hypothetical protein